MRALFIITMLALTTFAASSRQDLGLLTNYYHDCPASHGSHADELRRVVGLALGGDAAAMRLLLLHDGIFSTVDNEGYSEVPQALLRTLGDSRYATFIVHQPPDVQQRALDLYPQQIPGFQRRFPKTAKLLHDRTSR
jgi:hypothetical protein